MARTDRTPLEAAHATARALLTQLGKIEPRGLEAVELLEAKRGAQLAADRLDVIASDRARGNG
jgi:hypothetical protein